ncbi:unnamed protein product [Prorocentrum cordatum]|uniref:ATP-dependent DNA helicase n=1 Tax=Prorocentrum cordatum TaxID=2364126 RepID=A0ABN9QM37_9DINO|nr:unnamed protein product [Polarella glacialis]
MDERQKEYQKEPHVRQRESERHRTRRALHAAQSDDAFALLDRHHDESGYKVSRNSWRLRAASEAAPPADHLKQRIADDVVRYCSVTEADERRMRDSRPQGPQHPAEEKCSLESLPHDHWIRYSDADMQALNDMPAVDMANADGASRVVHTALLRSYWRDPRGNHFHVHPELVNVDGQGPHFVFLRPVCHRAAVNKGASPPPFAIAAGVDFGLLCRLGLDAPSELEALALADVRACSLVAKVHVPQRRATVAPRTVLRGHMISFLQDGPAALGKHFDEARLANILANVQLLFVGPDGKTTGLERRALSAPAMQTRPHVLYNHLALRQALEHVSDMALPSVDELGRLLASLHDRLAAQARCVVDDAVEQASLPSDVANVRDVAMRDDLQAMHFSTSAGGDPAPPVALDPVGVIARTTAMKSSNGATASLRERPCARELRPMNEFTNNGDILYGAFWHLFPLRQGLRSKGSVGAHDSRHLLTQFHNSFAQQPSLLFLLANQVQRHAAAKGVGVRVKTDPDSFQTFANMMADKDAHLERLRVAKEDPASKSARDLLKQVLRFTASAGKGVIGGGVDGGVSVDAPCKAIQLSYRAGKADVFPSSPDALLPVLRGEAPEDAVQRLCEESLACSPDATYKFDLDEAFLQTLATMNPVATTLVYEQMSEAIFTELVALPPNHRRKKSVGAEDAPKGFLGTPFGWSFVHETNQRKSFHFHASVHAGATPELLADVAGFPALETVVCQALDTVYRAYVSPEIHALDLSRRLLRVPAAKLPYFQTRQVLSDADSLSFDIGAAITAATTGFHQHASTCHKGASGKDGCRMARPAGHPVPETRALAGELANPDADDPGADQAMATPGGRVQWACADCRAPSRFWTRRAAPRHDSGAAACLSYELCRPRIAPDSTSFPTLQHVMGLSEADAEAMAGSEALRLVGSVRDELRYLLERRELPPALGDRMRDCSNEEALKLIRAWRGMSCRNAWLVEYCPVLSGSLGSNTAPLLLGAGDSAKAAGMYMCKYMVKDACELAASLSVLADARDHIDRYSSSAIDGDTGDRAAKHFLQRVLNSAATELAPAQAAAIAMGVSSSGHSHSFVNSYVWDAVHLLQELQRGGALLSTASASPAAGKASSATPASECGSTGDAAHGGPPDVVDAAEHVDAPVRQGTCSIYKTTNGESIAVSQAEHYAYRSLQLLPLTFDEFVMSMQVAKMSRADERSQKPGRRPNATCELLEPHPLAAEYEIKAKAKFDVPIFVGQPPPRLPPVLDHARGKQTMARQRKERLHADYFMAVFSPWHASTASGVDIAPAGWQAFLGRLDSDAAGAPPASTRMRRKTPAQEDVHTRIAQGRLFRIEQVSQALASSTSQAKTMNAWRCRNRTLWRDDHLSAAADDPAAGPDATSRKAADDIADIKARAARRADARCINRAAQAESWGDDNFASLRRLSQAASSSTTSPTWPADAPSPTGRATMGFQEDGGRMAAVLQTIANPRSQDMAALPSPREAANRLVADGGSVPPAFADITQQEFAVEVAEWKRQCGVLLAGAPRPPPPLNPPQRQFARDHLSVQQHLAQARAANQPRANAAESLAAAGLSQIHLPQGAGGVGKSVLLEALKTTIAERRLGVMVVTAWTGVASAPFGPPTLCSLLKIDFANMAGAARMTDDALQALRADFTQAVCRPRDLLVLVIDECSFLVAQALSLVDTQLRRLLGEPDAPFGGIAIILTGDFWQKPPPGGVSMAEQLAATEVPELMRGTGPLDPTSTTAKGLEFFRQTNPARASATIAVLSNFERRKLNRLQVEAFARAFQLPLLTWKLPLTGKAAELLDGADLDELYENEPGLWGVNVQLVLPDGDDGAGIESLVDDAVVVPILCSRHMQGHDMTSLFSCLKAMPKSVRYRGHAITLAFAVTDYKLQGKTKDELILSIAPRPFPPHLDLKGFYVDVSRVRKRSGLRVLRLPPKKMGGLKHLYGLQHTRDLTAWNAGYDASGEWCRRLARASLKKRPVASSQKVKPVAKQ